MLKRDCGFQTDPLLETGSGAETEPGQNRLTKSCGSKRSPGNISFMWRIGFLLACLIASAMSEAQTTTLTLLEDLSSKLPTGTAFTAKDAAGKVYSGHLVTHPARRLLLRGSMSLVFDDPVVPVTKDPEGVLRAGNKMRLLKLGAHSRQRNWRMTRWTVLLEPVKPGMSPSVSPRP
jgi:hypothetical protein